MYQRTVLPNGVRIITEHVPYLRSVTLGAWFEAGSRHEKPHQWGIAHFIEHMMFKGTANHSAREIAEIIDQRGGDLNAFTGKEQTCYYFKILDEHFAVAADLLQDMLLNSLFAPVDVDKEKNVVLEELNMYEDSPEEVVHDLFAAQIWPHDPLGKSILGSEATIAEFSPAVIREYLTSHYTSERLVIACVGNITHSEVVDKFGPALSRLPEGTNREVLKPRHELAGACFQDKDIEQVHLCLGGPALSRLDERKYALHLLDTMLGGGVSSLLFQELREERGLVYNTYSFTSLYSDVGYYGIYAGFRPQNWGQVWDVLTDLFKNVAELFTPEMLERAKGQMKSGLLLSLESTSNRMFRLAKGEMDRSRVLAPPEVMEKIDQVQYAELVELAKAIYNPDHWTWVGLGPSELVREDATWKRIC